MKNNIMITGIVFLICLFIFQTTVHADSGQLYKVDSETLELRDAPEQNAAVVTELGSGEQVTVFEDTYGWGKTYYNGKEAWAAIYQLAAVNDIQTEQADAKQPEAKVQQDKTAESGEIDRVSQEWEESGILYQVKASSVRLRNAPDGNANIITELNNGEEVTIFEDSFGWGKTYYNGKEGWIALYLLDKKNESTAGMVTERSERGDQQQATEETERQELEVEPVQKNEVEESATEIDEKNDEKVDEKTEPAVETEVHAMTKDVKKRKSGEKTLSGYHFVLDPGHGGKDTGAIGTEREEKTLTLSTAKKVEQQLRDQGASVTLTRKDDAFIPLEERVNKSNATDTDVFISLHYNSYEDPSVHGIHTFFYNGENQKLAGSIQKSLVDHVKLADRGAKQADFQVLRDNKQLALLIELGFISNPEEQQLVQTDKYQEKAAKGIVDGLENYFR